MEDVESLAVFANNWNIAKNMTDQFPHPYDEQNAKTFITFATKNIPVHIFAIEVGGKAVGGIGLHPQSDVHKMNAELGYWLAEPFWGQGIISHAINEVVNIGFEQLEINRIFARPFGTNVASQKVLEKNGFKLEGRFEKTLIKNGILLDELIYALRKADWKSTL